MLFRSEPEQIVEDPLKSGASQEAESEASTETQDMPDMSEGEGTALQYRITEKPELPKLNRAQRRARAAYLMHTKEAQQMRQAKRASDETRGCPRCDKYFFVPSMFAAMPGIRVDRCQCNATVKRYGP